ncbi:MAG: TIGR01212 family radical SAM protein [Treponema sp.]|nr:TIGR01212 family radical SAM protein [Treponema sp.]
MFPVQCRKSVNEYYREIFGHKVYKLSLDAGCTCPNRDGTKSNGGCIFCSAEGSGEFTAGRNLNVSEQIKKAELLVEKKLKNPDRDTANYIAYFQSFTNTYGDENLLLEKYREALSSREIAGIAIATRPDCLSDSILKKINALSKEKFACGNKFSTKHFSIELGLQTSNPKTALYINRCYDNSEYEDAVKRIKKINPYIHIVTHIIFGLPGESEIDMLNSVKYACSCGTDGIKIQVLNILKGTKLEKEYEEGWIKVLGKEEYFELVKKAFDIIPDNVIIHRLTGDGAKRILVAPEWVKNKRAVINEMRSLLKGKINI